MSTISVPKLAKELQTARDALSKQRDELIGERKALLAESEELWSAPLNKDDVVRLIESHIDARAAEFPREGRLGSMLECFIYPFKNSLEPIRKDPATGLAKPVSLRHFDAVTSPNRQERSELFGNPHGPLFLFSQNLAVTSELMWFYWFGDAIKAKLREEFDKHVPGYQGKDQQRIGPPIEERRKRLGEIDMRVAEIDASVADLNSELKELA